MIGLLNDEICKKSTHLIHRKWYQCYAATTMQRRDSFLPVICDDTKMEVGKTLKSVERYLNFLIEHECPFLNNINTPQKVRKAAKVLMAIGNVIRRTDWEHVNNQSATTKSIIRWINHVFGDNINPGGYDNIRRNLLRPLLLAGLVKQPTDMARNNPTRGFYIADQFLIQLRTLVIERTLRLMDRNAKEFSTQCKKQLAFTVDQKKCDHVKMLDSLKVDIGEGRFIWLEKGEHNLLQKAVIELFLPTYDPLFKVLYLGDAKERYLVYDKQSLTLLGVADMTQNQKLPDVLVWCPSHDCILVIEAVHSSGAVTDMRLAELCYLFKNVDVKLCYLTVLKDQSMFKRFSSTIGKDTMVWIMENTDQVIKFETIQKPDVVNQFVDCIIDY